MSGKIGNIEALNAVKAILEKALRDTPPQYDGDGAHPLHEGVAEALQVIDNHLEKLHIKEQSGLKLPEKAPIKWADRKIFVVVEIEDEYTRKKLEENPELEKEIRDCPQDNPLKFLRLVYGDFIDAGIMYQKDLRGGQGANGGRALDKTLYDRCYEQCTNNQLEFGIITRRGCHSRA